MNRCMPVVLPAVLGLGAAAFAGQAPAIEVYQAHEIKPYKATGIQPDHAQGRPTQDAPARHAAAGCNSLVGAWQTNVPGAVYITPGSSRYYNVLHVSAGGPKGFLRIKANGTYTWNTYGGKQGRWLRSDDPEYPLILVDNAEHKRWKVGCDAKHTGGREIVIWDGYINYDGRR
jgi:hypothetical protein